MPRARVTAESPNEREGPPSAASAAAILTGASTDALPEQRTAAVTKYEPNGEVVEMACSNRGERGDCLGWGRCSRWIWRRCR
jgi:hypothetical protein